MLVGGCEVDTKNLEMSLFSWVDLTKLKQTKKALHSSPLPPHISVILQNHLCTIYDLRS